MLTFHWDRGTITAAIYDGETGDVATTAAGTAAQVDINIQSCKIVS